MDDPISRCIAWIAIVICIIFSFYFSASETALSCCNRFKMQIKADEGSRSAKLVLKTCEKFDRALTMVLVGNNIVAIVSSVLLTGLFRQLFIDSGIEDFWISLIASISLSIVVYIVGDSFPKTIAKAIPDTFSLICAVPNYILLWILTYIIPVTLLFEGFVKLIEKIFKVKQEDEFTAEDLEEAIDKVTDDGVIEEEQQEIIQSALDFVDTNVKEVLTPREKIFSLNIRDLTHEKLHGVLMSTKYSRIPIYDTSEDNIIGVLNVKTYFKEINECPNISIRKILQKPYFVDNSIMIDDLFNGFKRRHTHIAIVRDANKKIVGMVTMEDILEELVEGISEPNTQKARRA